MFYGLDHDDIIQSFNSTQGSDWATNGISGAEIITNELELAFDESLQYLHPAIVAMIEGWIAPHLFADVCPNEDGEYIITLLGEPECIQIRILDEFNGALCHNPCETFFNDFAIFEDYEVVGNEVILGESYDPDTTLIVSYHSDDLNIPSLARYLRNKVCCTVGHQLFSAGSDVWALVDHYCSEASKFEDRYDKKGFIPPEFKKLKWLNYPFSVGFFSVRVNRV